MRFRRRGAIKKNGQPAATEAQASLGPRLGRQLKNIIENAAENIFQNFDFGEGRWSKMMEGLSKNEVSILFSELGGTPETILFSQVGVSPAREAIFQPWEAFR